MFNKKEYMREYNLQHKKEKKIYRQKHKNDIKIYKQEYCRNHKEEIKNYWQERKKKYKEKILDNHRRWYWEHRDDVIIKEREYYWKHREKITARKREMMHKNGIHKKYNTGISLKPEYKKRSDQLRRMRHKNGGLLTLAIIQQVYEDNIKRYGTLTCVYCEQPILFGQDSLDHKIPVSRNGKNSYENLCIACRKCNSSKGNKTVEEFEIYRSLRNWRESQEKRGDR